MTSADLLGIFHLSNSSLCCFLNDLWSEIQSDLITSDVLKCKKQNRHLANGSAWSSLEETDHRLPQLSDKCSWKHHCLEKSFHTSALDNNSLKYLGSSYFTQKSGVENESNKVWKFEDKQSKNLRYTSYSGEERRRTHTLCVSMSTYELPCIINI